MELSELTAYAREKYNIEEQHKWTDFPGFSVLCHPRTGKWVALLMRQWDTDAGEQIERCDIKCGRQSLAEYPRQYLSAPVRMQGQKWIGAAFDRSTEPEVIFALFDRAYASEEDPGYARGATIVLQPRRGSGPAEPAEVTMPADSYAADAGHNQADAGHDIADTGRYLADGVYRDTALPFAGSAYRPRKEQYPEKLRQMRSLFHYGWESRNEKALNFCRQGKFMEEYEDNGPMPENFICYFPTYQDLTTKQLRGYFSWRTLVRKGKFRPVTPSAAYIYIYELLNGIGAASVQESLRKLQEFEERMSLGTPTGTPEVPKGWTKDYAAMRRNLRRWMMELAVVRGLDPETVRRYADPELLEKDTALAVLHSPAAHSDREVFEALCRFGGKRTAQSPAATVDPDRGGHLFAEVWRMGMSGGEQEEDLFTQCFGTRKKRQWFPLSNAVFYQDGRREDTDLWLDGVRRYCCRENVWYTECYEEVFFDRNRFREFLHETDAKLRRYLKTGRYLKERPEGAFAAAFADAVIEADKKAVLEAARPKITINLAGLDQIRKDAVKTRDSLLTEEERLEAEEYADIPESSRESIPDDIPLDEEQIRILQLLLMDETQAVKELIREKHLMPSLAADLINEAMYDEIGDIILVCEDDELSLVDDYREDIAQMLEGI